MSAIEISEELFAEAKNYLDITWQDPDGDQKLKGQIGRGIAYISDKTGVDPSAFSGENVNRRAQGLLFNYLLYARAGAFAQFVENYAFEFNSLRRRTVVSAAKEAEP